MRASFIRTLRYDQLEHYKEMIKCIFRGTIFFHFPDRYPVLMRLLAAEGLFTVQEKLENDLK